MVKGTWWLCFRWSLCLGISKTIRTCLLRINQRPQLNEKWFESRKDRYLKRSQWWSLGFGNWTQWFKLHSQWPWLFNKLLHWILSWISWCLHKSCCWNWYAWCLWCLRKRSNDWRWTLWWNDSIRIWNHELNYIYSYKMRLSA